MDRIYRTAHRLHAVALAVVAVCALPRVASALPEGAKVIRGTVGIQSSGTRMDLLQSTGKAIVEWRSFGLKPGEAFNLLQPGANAAMLARVTGAEPSTLLGSITANGRLYLINPNGVLVGPDGRIDTAAFTASTRDVADAQFMADGPLLFTGGSRAGVVNMGVIRATTGSVLLVGHSVRNAGSIEAPRGAANLVAADEIFLADPAAPDVLVRAGTRTASEGTAVDNSGVIAAAQARLEAASGDLYSLAVNQTGQVRAAGFENIAGRIVLTAAGGTVRQAGTLSAANADGSGGTIRVGGDERGQGGMARAGRTEVTADAVLDASATAPAANGGSVVVWADDATDFRGTAKARGGAVGGDGGAIEISGKRQLRIADGAVVDARAPAGRAGDILLDPDQITIAPGGTDTSATGSIVTMSGATLSTLLTGGNVTLDTSTFNPELGSGDILVSDAVAWSGNSALTLRSGNGITLDGSITATAGSLSLLAGKSGHRTLGGEGAPDIPELSTITRVNPGSSIDVDTLRVGVNSQAAPVGGHYTFDSQPETSLSSDGTISAKTLTMDLSAGNVGGFVAGSIGAVRTTGSGVMSFLVLDDTTGDLNANLKTSADWGYISLTTPGKLTLESGTSLAFTDPTANVVLASTGANFVNQAGSSAISGARFLIYSNSPGSTTKGGLAGVDEFSRTYAGNPPDNYSGDTTSRFLFSSAGGGALPELTYTASPKTRLYGDPNPALTYSVSGLQPGDVLGEVTTGAPELSTNATLRSGRGVYTINISRGTLDSSEYGFNFVPGLLTVNPAPLTIDIANATRSYGDANPAFTASVSGLKAGDTAASILGGWRFGSNATVTSGVGNYAIRADSLSPSTNYTYTFKDGVLTVVPASVLLSLDPTARLYGDANPNFVSLAAGAGLRNGDTVASAFPSGSFSTAATTSSPAGTYPVSAAGTFTNPNYAVTWGDIGALTVNKAPLLVRALDAARLYGDANPAFGFASVTGFRLGDTLASVPELQLVSAATGSSNVGAYPIVPSGSAANYVFVAGGGTLTVNPAPLTIRFNEATRVYGDANPPFTVTYEGLKNGETSVPGVTPESSATNRSPVGSYLILSPGTIGTQNYLPTFYAGQLHVMPRPLAVKADDAQRVYGEAGAPLSVAVTGATAWDAAQAASYWIATGNTDVRANAGTYAITPAANPFGDRFDNLANYAVTLLPGVLTVTRAPLAVLPTPVSILWGDGLPPLQYTLGSGLRPWDTPDATRGIVLASDAGGTASAPGNYPIVLASNLAGANYEAYLSGNPQVTVQRRPISIMSNATNGLNVLTQTFPGQIEPFTVRSYAGGNLILSVVSSPLAGGPLFSVLGGTDGTPGPGDNSYVTTSFIQPAPGYTLDDVLRYYDPVSKPGVVTASPLAQLSNLQPGQINTNVIIQQDAQVKVKKQTVRPRDTTAPGQPPSLRNLMLDTMSDDAALAAGLRAFINSPVFAGMAQEDKQLLIAALANESSWQYYNDNVNATIDWIASVKASKPDGWQAMVASAEADIASWRAEMAKMPSLQGLRDGLAAGDPAVARALTPFLAIQLVNAVKAGTLPPDTQQAILNNINSQRQDIVQVADRKYNEAMNKRQGTSLVDIVAAPKVPDIVGQAFIEVADRNRIEAERGAAAGGVLGAGAVMGAATMAIVRIAGYQGTSYSLLGNFGAGVLAGPAVIIAAAIAIGTAEAVQVVESTSNYERYLSFKAANQQLGSMSQFDVSNKDNAAQLMTAVTMLLGQSLGKGK